MKSPWSPTFQEAVDYLRAALPATDIAMHGDTLIQSVAGRALRIRKEAPWGTSIPRDVFLPYVLYPRVNNEYLENNTDLFEQVLPLVNSLSMQEAALKVNLWCFEQATYRSTDNRTASPGAVIRAGFGRCGEESTLAVCALRSCGIPARQIYVPRWAHCDDNHAWVEVWIDGQWHFMGACEPETKLDIGWFIAAASKAMMVHTRCYGLIPQDERVEKKEAYSCVINRTAAYAPTCLLTVDVHTEGKPIRGALVRFLLCNEAEFAPICEKATDENGRCDLLTGFGGLMIEVIHQGRRLYRCIDLNQETKLSFDLKFASLLPTEPLRFSLVPPVESRMQTIFPSAASRKMHGAALQVAEQRRLARLDMSKESDPFVKRAASNAGEIRAFLADERFDTEDKIALLSTLSEKDFFDATHSMLADALLTAPAHKASFPLDVWMQYILCPRIAFEKRLPVRQALLAFPGVSPLRTPKDVWTYAKNAVRLRPAVPDSLYPDSLTALHHGFTTEEGLHVLFVDLCRALGFPARLDMATGACEYFDHGVFISPEAPAQKKAELTLISPHGIKLPYGERLSIAKVDDKSTHTLFLRGITLKDSYTVPLDAGQYLITCVTRQIDGTVDGVSYPLTLNEGEAKSLSVDPPSDQLADHLLRVSLPPISTAGQDSAETRLDLADFSGTGGILSFIAPGEEPSEHFLLELREKEKIIQNQRLRVTLIVETAKASALERLQGLSFARIVISDDPEGLITWRSMLRCGDVRKPFSIAVDQKGTALFAYANYHVGSVETLLRILESENLIRQQ